MAIVVTSFLYDRHPAPNVHSPPVHVAQHDFEKVWSADRHRHRHLRLHHSPDRDTRERPKAVMEDIKRLKRRVKKTTGKSTMACRSDVKQVKAGN